ncbi:ABC transporter, partial [Streptomyces spiralis]
AHLACLFVALAAAVVLGTAATVVVTLISDPAGTDHRTRVPMLQAGGAGLLAALVCALLGTAVGAVTNRPVLRSTGRAVPVMLLAALLSMVTTGSPAQAAVSGLVTGSRTGRVPLPLLPLAGAAVLAAVAIAASCALTARRSP